jgi:sRNA-binding carbon storage regulator CsrA
MTFIKWLGMHVPTDVETRIMSAENHVNESILVSNEILTRILHGTGGSGVPLGLNVESLSIFKEEIVGAHDMFQILQVILL